jgi:hypothetical protein
MGLPDFHSSSKLVVVVYLKPPSADVKMMSIELQVIVASAGKQLSQAATDV